MYRILIVEDDPVIAKAIQNHLQNWGCTVYRVEDFSKVLEAFVSFSPS